MIRYALRGLSSQWTAWVGTFVILALGTALSYVCLIHRYTVTRPEIVARARALGIGPNLLEMSGTSVYFYSALVTIPVVAIVGRSCVQALRTTWAQWRLAGALPRQIRGTVIATIALIALASAIPGIGIGMLAAQPVSGVLTRMAAATMGPITIHHNPWIGAATIASIVLVAIAGALGPAMHAARVPATAALRDTPATRQRVGLIRWLLIAAWTLVCAAQAFLYAAVEPIPTGTGLPAGGGQAMLLALLLAVWVVIAAPVIVPPVLRAWTAPLARLGGSALIARRSAAWRSDIGSSAVALLALGITFTSAMLTAAHTNDATAAAAGLNVTINQLDTYVLAAILALIATCGAVAIIAMTSRSREKEFATLRCAGATPARLRGQAAIEPLIYVGTALALALLPTILTALGEAWFLHRAGLPFHPAPALAEIAALALLADLALTGAVIAPARRALRIPINSALAPE